MIRRMAAVVAVALGLALVPGSAQAHYDSDYAEAFNLDNTFSFQYRFYGAGGDLYKSWLHPGTNSGQRDVYEIIIPLGKCATVKQVQYDTSGVAWVNYLSVRGHVEVNAHRHGMHTAPTDIWSC